MSALLRADNMHRHTCTGPAYLLYLQNLVLMRARAHRTEGTKVFRVQIACANVNETTRQAQSHCTVGARSEYRVICLTSDPASALR